jgi:hypothetical protein
MEKRTPPLESANGLVLELPRQRTRWSRRIASTLPRWSANRAGPGAWSALPLTWNAPRRRGPISRIWWGSHSSG